MPALSADTDPAFHLLWDFSLFTDEGAMNFTLAVSSVAHDWHCLGLDPNST